MKRSLHTLALLLFALTQFVAPFAHAHVDGIHRDASIHTSDIPRHLHQDGLKQCHIESHESQAIGPQQEYQRDDVAAFPSAPATVALRLSAGHVIPPDSRYEPTHVFTFSYHRPHPQAPPA